MRLLLRAAAAALVVAAAAAASASPSTATPEPPTEGAPCVSYDGVHGFWQKKNPDYPFSYRNKKCVPTPTTPEAPLVTQPICFDGTDTSLQGSVTIHGITGVVYSLDGAETAPGTYLVGAGDHVVTAAAAVGYVFPEDATVKWDLVVGVPPGCPGDDGAPGAPGEVRPVTVSQAPAATPVRGRPAFTG